MASGELWQKGELMIPIGNKNTFVTCSNWNDQRLIHIRRYVKPDDNQDDDGSSSDDAATKKPRLMLLPSKKGIAMTEAEFDQLHGLYDKVKKAFKKGPQKNSKKKE